MCINCVPRIKIYTQNELFKRRCNSCRNARHRAPEKVRKVSRKNPGYLQSSAELLSDWEGFIAGGMGCLPTTKARALVEIRKDIESSYQIVRTAVEDLLMRGIFSLENLNNRLKRAGGDTLNIAFEGKIAEMKAQERIGNMMAYRVVVKGIERFAGPRVPLSGVSVDWIRRYEKFLLKEGKSRTTVGIHMRHIRAILNDMKRCGKISEAQYPFGRGRYEIQAGEGRKLALTLEQIGQIANYEDGTEATAKYRDYWLFLYLCNGINVADFVKLRYRDIVNGEICFVRQKTERTTKIRHEIRVVVTERMQAIIDRWGNPPRLDNFIFPILDGQEDAMRRKLKTMYFTRAINKRMKEVGERLGIGNISTYTARHSFATVLKRAGTNIAYISESLGHQDLKTTENYLASFEREERVKNAELLTKF